AIQDTDGCGRRLMSKLLAGEERTSDDSKSETVVHIAEYGRVGRLAKAGKHTVLVVGNAGGVDADCRIQDGRTWRQHRRAPEHVTKGQLAQPFECHLVLEGRECTAQLLLPIA